MEFVLFSDFSLHKVSYQIDLLIKNTDLGIEDVKISTAFDHKEKQMRYTVIVLHKNKGIPHYIRNL